MKSATGRWVSGNDFFDRESELRILEQRVCDGNHVLLTGQRRMGKTSLVRELGRRLTEGGGWAAIGAVEEVGASGFRLKIRARLSAGNWRDHGEELFRACAAHERRVLLLIDELPIFFLKRLLRAEDGATEVDGFLSWLRGVIQGLGGDSPVLIVSGSIGLMPLVQRLSIAMEILAETATQGVLTAGGRSRLGAHGRVTEVIDVLLHDGYLELRHDGYRFPSHLLKDWWAARFRDHHVPLESRAADVRGDSAP